MLTVFVLATLVSSGDVVQQTETPSRKAESHRDFSPATALYVDQTMQREETQRLHRWRATNGVSDLMPLLHPEVVFHNSGAPIQFGANRSEFSNRLGSGNRAFVIRAQGAPYDEEPPVTSDLAQQPLMSPIFGQTPAWPSQGGIWPGSPILAPQGMAGGPAPMQSQYGATGPQPYRFGWSSRFDVGILPKARTSGGAFGHFEVFEFNSELRHTAPLPNQWIFSLAPQFNLRSWGGPGYTNPGAASPAPTAGLSGHAYRFGSDFQLTSPTVGAHTVELGFTPAYTSDFEDGGSSDAWLWDGRGAIFIRTNPQWLMVLGAMFWDRVNDQVLPYAGLVYTPNDWMEFRATFPKAEASFFLGTPWGVPQWLYFAGEYHVEAYEVEVSAQRRADPLGEDVPLVIPPNAAGVLVATRPASSQIELEDWRVLLGIRSEQGSMTSFLEAGWVFGRDVDLSRVAAPRGFDISSGFIARFGVTY